MRLIWTALVMIRFNIGRRAFIETINYGVKKLGKQEMAYCGGFVHLSVALRRESGVHSVQMRRFVQLYADKKLGRRRWDFEFSSCRRLCISASEWRSYRNRDNGRWRELKVLLGLCRAHVAM